MQVSAATETILKITKKVSMNYFNDLEFDR